MDESPCGGEPKRGWYATEEGELIECWLFNGGGGEWNIIDACGNSAMKTWGFEPKAFFPLDEKEAALRAALGYAIAHRDRWRDKCERLAGALRYLKGTQPYSGPS